jgi:MraZ protein
MDMSQNAGPIFAGEFRHAMDAKNRVTIPSRWRSGETEEFFAIPDLNSGCLMVMPPAVVRRVPEKLDQDNRLAPQERSRFLRQFFSRAQQISSDKQGRIVIPEDHCRQLGLRGEVVLVGNHERFEIWSRDAWKRAFEEDQSTFQYVLGTVGL